MKTQSIIIDTTPYKKVTGKEPRGKGNWCFMFSGIQMMGYKMSTHNIHKRSLYSKAVKAAKAKAERLGVNKVTLVNYLG